MAPVIKDENGEKRRCENIAETEIGKQRVDLFIKRILGFADVINLGNLIESLYSSYLNASSLDRLKTNFLQVCQKELRDSLVETCSHSQLAKKFTTLHNLEEEYKDSKAVDAWRPPGNVESHCRTAAVIVNKKLKNELHSLIKLKMTEINKLKTDVLDALEKSKQYHENLKLIEYKISLCKRVSESNEQILQKSFELRGD